MIGAHADAFVATVIAFMRAGETYVYIYIGLE